DFDKTRGYMDYCPKEFEEVYDLFSRRLANVPISLNSIKIHRKTSLKDVIKRHREMVLALGYLKKAGMSSISEITEKGMCKAFYIHGGPVRDLSRPMKELVKLLQSEGLMNNDFHVPTYLDVKEYDLSLRLKEKEEDRLKFDAMDKLKCEELRDRAIALLAVKTGASASDICCMRLLPSGNHFSFYYPPDVVNALNEYVEKGRPDIEFRYLFIMTNAPARSIRRSKVEVLIDRALENQRLENQWLENQKIENQRLENQEL
ncbi:MAG: hypothetical protein LBT59_02545, partial [Clostridiales bacterium]|nr:hypothetical protein [Clostridiales bacterium]